MRFFRWLENTSGESRIEGLRVKLRPPRMEDYTAWKTLRGESRNFLEPWEPLWAPDELSSANYRRRLRAHQRWADFGLGQQFFIFDKADGVLLGGITLGNIRRGAQLAATLGYWIGQRHQRHGFMKEAVAMLCEHCFSELGLNRVEAACLPRNAPSRALLGACGFQEEGYARDYVMIAGVWEDHILYARLRSDPPQSLS